MNKREFFKKFIALSSVSLILTGCIGNQERAIYPEPNNKKVKFKNIISDPNGEQSITSRPNNNGFKPIIQK
ncbi:MAG: hypothetical protein KAG56_02625 [Sulfurovaceae bacterium]|nr:hypothetical protein [Sulfurovaceae bacterium]